MTDLASMYSYVSSTIDYIASNEWTKDLLFGLVVTGGLSAFITKIQRDSDREAQVYLRALERNNLRRVDDEFGDLERTIMPKRFYNLQAFFDCGDISCMDNEMFELQNGYRRGFEGIFELMTEGKMTRPEAFNRDVSLEYMTNTVDMYRPTL